MPWEILHSLKSINVAATFAEKQFRFVTLDGSGLLTTASAGGYAIGVIQDNPSSAGSPGMVCGPGSITMVMAGGTVAAGDDVASDSDGNAVAATSGDSTLGKVLEGGDSGDLVTILYQPSGVM